MKFTIAEEDDSEIVINVLNFKEILHNIFYFYFDDDKNDTGITSNNNVYC